MDATPAMKYPSSDGQPRRSLGRALIRYRDRCGWNDEALAAFLQCDAWGLARLAFFPLVSAQAPTFAEQVAALATVAGCATEPLVTVLVDVDVDCWPI